jgi:3-hydroxybutyryl-CoA dehydrogenase
VREKLGIAGSGAIACGLAATASAHGDVVMWVRSAESARRAAARLEKAFSGAQDGADPGRVRVITDPAELAHQERTLVVEAIAEDPGAKGSVLATLNGVLPHEALLATTTSSLPVGELARASGRPDRFLGLHVFNPVPKMRLVELAFPSEAGEDTRRRAHALCQALDKTAVEVPDRPGFVVNRLLFPYLFSAVWLLEDSGLEPQAIDDCMALGAGHPMGPLALLDFVGLDVAAAIGQALGVEVPARVHQLVKEGHLGRKSGRGFYTYQ